MELSFFSKEQVPDKGIEKEIKEEPKNLLASVRTMKEDIEEARREKQKMPAPQAEKQKMLVPQAEKQEVKNSLPQKSIFQKTFNLFGEKEKKVPQVPAKAEEKPVVKSPFGFVSQAKNSPVPNVLVPPPVQKKSFFAPTLSGSKAPINQQKKNEKVLWAGAIGILALILVAGGVFYFYSQNNQKETVSSVPPASPVPPSPPPNIVPLIPPKSLPFALDKPNYLSFNTETVSAEDIKKKLSEVALLIKEANIIQPIEFLVTDQNNGPLAFNRFAFLSKINLASDVLALLGEPFSLYAYNDAGQVRFGLALTFKDAPVAAAAVTKIETSLPKAFQALMLEPDIKVADSIPFHVGTYNQFTIRYANVDEAKNVSLDYAIDDTEWFIGTSKNTLRVILDRQPAKSAITAP